MIKNVIFWVVIGLIILITLTTEINYGDHGFDKGQPVYAIENRLSNTLVLFIGDGMTSIYNGDKLLIGSGNLRGYICNN